MPRALAINVGANTNLPGVRGPIYPDGSFVYLPIPEREPLDSAASVPTYAELLAELPPLPMSIPPESREQPVHLDPQFETYPFCEFATYGDEHGLKAGPISELQEGDSLFFYATLTSHDPPDGVDTGDPVSWVAPEWGVYLIGEFRVAEILAGDACQAVSPADHPWIAGNAHSKRDTPDAKVLVRGNDDSSRFERAVPLSTPEAGTEANRIVTDLSNDSGKGPWWRRRLWFEAAETDQLRALVERHSSGELSSWITESDSSVGH